MRNQAPPETALSVISPLWRIKTLSFHCVKDTFMLNSTHSYNKPLQYLFYNKTHQVIDRKFQGKSLLFQRYVVVCINYSKTINLISFSQTLALVPLLQTKGNKVLQQQALTVLFPSESFSYCSFHLRLTLQF